MLWPETTRRAANGDLVIGGVAATRLAADYGTPLYIFDEQTLRGRARRFRDAFAAAYPQSHVTYASKAYLSPALVQLLINEGLGLDVVSGGELYAALQAGVTPDVITFHGNNKSEDELRQALAVGIGTIVVDNDWELTLLERLTADRQGQLPVPIMLRLTPGIDVHTHEKIRTGILDTKFGFPLATGSAERAVARALEIPGVELIGYHAHLGSQLFEVDAYTAAVAALVEFAGQMRDRFGVVPRRISPGGGFGIAYEAGDEPVAVETWAAATGEALRAACEEWRLPLPELVIEPGRAIVGPAAIALYTVGAIKTIPGVRTYVAVDGGMADNIRPALYNAVYTAELANRPMIGPCETVTIAGKFCESGDLLIERVALPPLAPGDLLALPAAGAYCLAMASNYNLAPRPAVVLVADGRARLIRRRERYADLLAAEIWPAPKHQAVTGLARADET